MTTNPVPVASPRPAFTKRCRSVEAGAVLSPSPRATSFLGPNGCGKHLCSRSRRRGPTTRSHRRTTLGPVSKSIAPTFRRGTLSTWNGTRTAVKEYLFFADFDADKAAMSDSYGSG